MRLKTLHLKKRKYFLLVLLLCLAGMKNVDAQVSTWDGSCESWTNGIGTENNPFLIENAQQLAYLAYQVNNGMEANADYVVGTDKYYKLMIDIDLNGGESFQWTPIGSSSYSFGGHFDGNNHTISGLYINSYANRVGFFGCTNGATVMDLEISGIKISTTGYYAGGIIGVADGSTFVSGCGNNVNYISSDKAAYANTCSGGIIGQANNMTSITNCYSTGNVYSHSYSTSSSGGIVGQTGNTASIINCFNTGGVDSFSVSSYSGGIVGIVNGEANLTNNYNTADISSSADSYSYSGGIAGKVANSFEVYITNCYNTGDVTSTYNSYYGGGSSWSGGIVGQVESSIISNSYNVGNISSVGGAANVGGIVGVLNNGSVNNSYYLDTCGGNNNYGGEPQTEVFMKSIEFVDILNDGSLTYIKDEQPYINQGYPIFNRLYIQTLPASSVDYTSAVLNGSYVSGILDIVSQGFEYKKTTDQYFTTINCTAGETPYSYSLNDLESGTTYHYRAFITTDEGTAYGNMLEFTTGMGPLPANYISDGLIMYLDGINNTRNGHSTTTDVWEDLMGNYDLTVNNYASYAWEDNHFIGLGDGGFLNTGKTWQYFHSLNDDITIEIVTYIDCDKTSPSYRGLAGWHVGSDGTHFQNDQGSGRMQTLGLLPVTEADDQIATVSYTRNNGSFLNGIWKTNSSHLHLGFNSGYTAVFGNSHAQCRGWNDSIYCIRMYNRTLTPEEIAHNHNVDRERFIVDPSNASYITVSSNPTEGGTISGAGLYENGQTCTLSATPAQGYFFLNWTKNDYVVSTNPTYSFTVTGNATYTANFVLGLPELHITNLSHSTLIGGQQATISWTVKNNGSAATPNGATWHDHVWLSVESSVDVNSNNPILLGTFDNLSALNVGEYYMQTKTVNIPLEISGDYYLFVTTDAYDAYQINWDNNVVPIPYNPPPYISCLSHGGNVIYEQSECEQGYSPGSGYNDNFFYELVNIEVPILPDLQVTSVVPQTNFFSGSMVNVTATVSNLGENFTLTDHWVDALYIASEPDFNSSTTICLAVKQHSGTLGVGQSYQVHFSGRVPLTMYGEAYFFVYTDCYEQVYEHVLNHNNIMMSDAVNVILSPPADLVSADLTFPTSVSTGETFAYSYKVYNNGAGDPNVNNWVDKIYLCQNADTLDANAVLLKTINHYGGLHHGANYSISESMVLPSEITSGSYYLYVHADADNDVFEYLYDGNNLARSNAIYVTRPDLQVTQISVPEQITGGYPLNLSYTLTNVGEGIVRNRMVTDRVYISASGNINDTIRVANIKRNVYLPSGQNLTVMCNDLAPYSLTDGTYHLLVLTDCDNEINESNEGNNMLTHYPMSVLHQPLPDLQPVSLSLPAVIQAGEAVAVEFDITNIGDLDLLNSNCTFDIYATWSDKEILCPVQSQTLPLGNNVSIGIGQTVHFVRSVLVPPTVTSACSTFELIANKGRLVPELDTTNNVYTATVSVLDCPLPDLVVTNISANAMQSGVENQISFTVKNVGTADFEGGFNTTVYVRSITDTILCPLVLQVSPSTNNYTIPIGGTLSFTQKVLVPPMANASCNLLEIYVDEENQVLEANDDNNATTIVSTVINYPFDLKTTALQVPDSVWAGETTSLSWTVKNIGTCPSQSIPFYLMVDSTYFLVQGEILPQPWMDKVYVSEDEVLSDDDIEVCSVARSTVLQPDGTYTVVQSVTLPYSNLGSQFLLCVSDATHVTYDSDTLNNVKAIPVEVQLGSLPDLRNTSLIVEETMNYDRAYWVRYTVVNEGERVTQKETWTDAFYLGETMTTDEAFQLGSKIHHGALAVGETYTDSIEIILPNSLEGSYYLIGLTDATHQIYEHDNEDDNLLAVPVMVLPPNPSDLIAVQPDFPATVASGANMTVSWQLQNIGFNSAVGRVRNAVYLSTDAAWSSDDVMLDYVDIDINIATNAQQTCSLSGVLTNVPEGDYYVIVKVNILNALNESSYENNVCVSLMTTEVGYPTLAIGEQVDRSLAADQYIYYKLEVGPEYEGQTLSCTLTSANQQVANGLYLSHEAVPTLAQYDYGQYAPYMQEIEVLIPVLEQGVYYLLAKGSTQNGNPQQVSIATSIINFEILHIDADHGSNTGSITTKVTGAKFDSIMDFRLVQGGEYLPAEKVFFSNSTEAYTTFDLVDMPTGTYAMEAELPGGIITIKGNAFVIEEGLPAELAINVVAPSSVRLGNTFAVNIEYGNIGTTDLNVSGLVVVSLNGHPLGFTTETLEEGLTEISFDTGEANGNPDVMRPGYRGTKTILVKATHLSDYRLAVYAIRRQY